MSLFPCLMYGASISSDAVRFEPSTCPEIIIGYIRLAGNRNVSAKDSVSLMLADMENLFFEILSLPCRGLNSEGIFFAAIA